MPDIELLAEIITNEIMKAIRACSYLPVQRPSGAESEDRPAPKPDKRRIVCMEDLTGIKSGVFEVESDVIITPLARDFLRDRKIRIVYRQGNDKSRYSGW